MKRLLNGTKVIAAEAKKWVQSKCGSQKSGAVDRYRSGTKVEGEIQSYPAYAIVSGEDLEQGDIITECSVPSLTPAVLNSEGGDDIFDVEITRFDVIILTQSCDMVKGREKVDEVVLCPIFDIHEVAPRKTDKEQLRKGQLASSQLLLPNTISGWNKDFRVIQFRRVFSLPLASVRSICVNTGQRERLLPPYREHMSQAFARFYMRVGLPVDVPPFK